MQVYSDTGPRVRIIHETSPTKYFSSIVSLQADNSIRIVGLHRASAFKEWLRSGIREKVDVKTRTKRSASDFWMRIAIRRLRNETIILGIAPWDFRLIYFSRLATHNQIIYHTSWPFWQKGRVPRSYGLFDSILERMWHRFLSHPNVRVVAVISEAQLAISAFEPHCRTVLIPHAVESVFYLNPRLPNKAPLRGIFIGELSAKKGALTAIESIRAERGRSTSLTIVGEGEQRKFIERECSQDKRLTFMGPIRDRARLATILKEHDFLIVPSQRTKTWEELFGMVIVEAMAAGLAVISSDHVGPRSIMSDLPEMLVPEGSVSAIQAIVGRFDDDRDYLYQIKVRCSAIAKRYSVDNVRAEWLSAIKQGAYR